MSDPTVRLVLGDCLEHMAGLSGIDAVVSDPPYGMKWQNNQRFSGGKTRRGLGTRHNPIIGDDLQFDPIPILELGCPTILWGANHFWDRLPPGASLVWLKRNDKALGTFLSDAEMAYMSRGHGIYAFRHIFAGSSRAIDAGRTAYEGSAHPNQKPVALMRWCIEKLKLKPGSTILDPYMGSGTTGVAAIELGHNFVGFEIDPTHYASATKRINKALADRSDLLPLA